MERRAVVRLLGPRFARVVSVAVVRWPRLWRLFRRPLRGLFDLAAPIWAGRLQPGHLEALEAALATLEARPSKVLDVGTGTGVAAVALARRYPEAKVVGVDLSANMIDQALRLLPTELADRVDFQVADAADLRFPSESFDLVTLVNAIPFFDELERVVRPGGSVAFCFTGGPTTPIYVDPQRLHDELRARGFTEPRHFSAGDGTSAIATRNPIEH
jgi:SAM-dependent methyltransferase